MFTHFYISPQHGVSTNTHCFITNGFLKKDNTTRSRSSNNITNNNIYLYDNYGNGGVNGSFGWRNRLEGQKH